MGGFVRDLRLAVRSLLRRPGFTVVAVLTVGLGIGANTAVFTLVDGVLLRPLPLPEPDELISLQALGRDCGPTRPPSAWPLSENQQGRMMQFLTASGLI